MSKKTIEVLFEDLGDSLAADLLNIDMVTDDEIDGLLRAWGSDPRTLGRAGAEAVRAELDRRRLSWMDDADAKTREFQNAVGDAATSDVDDLSDEEVGRELQRLRRSANTDGALRAAFLKRAPESATPDERREMLRQARRLAAVSRRTGESDESGP